MSEDNRPMISWMCLDQWYYLQHLHTFHWYNNIPCYLMWISIASNLIIVICPPTMIVRIPYYGNILAKYMDLYHFHNDLSLIYCPNAVTNLRTILFFQNIQQIEQIIFCLSLSMHAIIRAEMMTCESIIAHLLLWFYKNCVHSDCWEAIIEANICNDNQSCFPLYDLLAIYWPQEDIGHLWEGYFQPNNVYNYYIFLINYYSIHIQDSSCWNTAQIYLIILAPSIMQCHSSWLCLPI
jgi:hypothetical protein